MKKVQGPDWDQSLRRRPTPHEVLSRSETHGKSAVIEVWGAWGSKHLSALKLQAKRGEISREIAPRRAPAPMPRRHYRVDWSAYGVAA